MRNLWVIALLMPGCIEYEPGSTLPPKVVPNQRPIEVTHQIDRLVQSNVPEVDVLFVIDNSTTMLDEQQDIAANFPEFMDFFLGSGLDYHIGVISTDMDDPNQSGRLHGSNGYRWIDDETVNPATVLSDIVVMGDSGSGNEKGRDPVYSAIEYHSQFMGPNDGFYREDAAFHVTILSDEYDKSDLVTSSEFVNWMQTLKWSADDVSFSSIVSPNPVCPEARDPGDDYIALTNQIGGVFWSICNDDWAQVVELLGLQAAGLSREYFLSAIPLVSSLDVWVVEDGITYEFEIDTDYRYDEVRNSIIFDQYVPVALAEIFVEYDVLSALEE